jgi:predicted DNA-binding protein (MmcQ/YjbR family)
MFALIGWKDDVARVNLKSDPQEAVALRSMFASVTPGYHMNKEHWNSVYPDDTVPDPVVLKMVDDSYRLIVKSLRKKDRQRLEEMSFQVGSCH